MLRHPLAAAALLAPFALVSGASARTAPGWTKATVQWSPGAVMQNFHSKTLNRTFPQILFSGGAQVVR